MKKGASIVSWICLGAAAITTPTGLLAHWMINAEAFGAPDMGRSLFLAILSAVALHVAMFWFAPAFLVTGLLVLAVDKYSGLRLLAAAGVSVMQLTLTMFFD